MSDVNCKEGIKAKLIDTINYYSSIFEIEQEPSWVELVAETLSRDVSALMARILRQEVGLDEDKPNVLAQLIKRTQTDKLWRTWAEDIGLINNEGKINNELIRD